MAPGLRCTGIVLDTWPILPKALTFAHSNSLILYHFDNNYTLFRIFLYSVPQLLQHWGAQGLLSRSACEHITFHSAYLGASGSICKAQCGCSVNTSKPFYIWLMQTHNITALGEHLKVPSITARKCISKLTWLQPAIAPDYGLQVHLWAVRIAASRWITKVGQSQPWSVSRSSLNGHLQAHLKWLPNSTCSLSRYSVGRWVGI